MRALAGAALVVLGASGAAAQKVDGGGVPYRMKIRSPSFCNLSILPKLCVGNLVSDVVSILGSLDFVMGECDR